MKNNVSQTIQRFTDWAKSKLQIHLQISTNGVYVKERQVWWVSLGQNIGSEQNGKHKKFERPVLVLKSFNAEMFLAVPLSSQIKPGAYRFVFKREGTSYTANLSQIRVLSTKRLLRQLGKMDSRDFYNLKKMFQKVI